MRFVLTALVLVLSVELFAQNDFIISGKFKVDGGTNNGAKIVVEKNGKQVKQLEGESRSEISLDFQAIYVVSFQKEGFVTKRLRFDTNVPEDRIEYGFELFPFTVEIFEQYDDINMVVFNQPVGRISYSELIDEFDYDTDYTKSIQAQIDQAMDEVEEAKEKKADQAVEAEKEVAQLSKTAESSAKSGNFEDAIKAYEEAQKLKKDPAIQNRIDELKKEVEGQKQQQQLEGILDKAEQAMAAGDLDEAKRLYEQANGVMAGDARVQKALAQIEEDKKAQTQQAQAFDSAVKAAEAALSSGNADQAIAKASEALKIKSDPKAEQILAQATKAKADAEAVSNAAAELDGKVADLIAEAQKAKSKGDLETALAKLEEAKQLKADPTIDQEIQSVKQAVAQLEEEKKKGEQAKAQLAGVLDEAEKLLANGDLAGAKAKLSAAGELGSDERIKAIAASIEAEEKRLANEASAAQEKQAAIDGLLKEANDLLAAGTLEGAEKKANEAKTQGADVALVEAILNKIKSQRDALAAEEAAADEAEATQKAQMDDKIAAAKSALAAGDLAGARSALQAAGALGSDPRIAELEKQIADQEKAQVDALAAEEAAKKAKEEAKAKYDKLIADGGAALSAKELTKAEKAFNDAKALSDDPKEAVDGLASVEQMRSELSSLQREQEAAAADAAAAAEQKKQLEDALAKADKAFEKESWDEAKALYSDALAIEQNDRAVQQIASIDQKLGEIAAARAAELAAMEASDREAAEEEAAKAAAEEAARKAAEEEAAAIATAKRLAEEQAAAQSADAAAAQKASEEEATRVASEQEAARAAEEAAKLAAEEAARKAEELAAASAGANDDSAAEEAARKAAEEAARKAAEVEAAKNASEAAGKLQEQIAAKRSEADGLFGANRLDPALRAYNELLTLVPNDPDAQKKISQIQEIKQKLAAEKAANEEAALAIADQRGRESEQLADIIEEEEIKAEVNPPPVQNTPDPIAEDQVESQVLSPSVSDPASFTTAQAVMEQEVRPGAPTGPIIISDDKVGEAARQTKTGQMTEDDKYDGMVKRTEDQVVEFQASEEMKALMAKYPDRRSEETEKVGNSEITWVYINSGEFITTYKKVVHNWGGVYFFVDGKATNQRFWEHESQ
ncbi:MAG: hypothetical protein HQ500_07460 [Flavobacteriales bacterium]|nr:hypothetical protein [Flavobacteriales bacterium]